MPKSREIKKRIRGIENIQEITRAMKLVAAARIKKAEERVTSCRPYSEKIKELMNVLLNKEEQNFTHELMTERSVKKIAFVVVSGDKGLCGAFNNNIFRFTDRFIEENKDKKILFIPVGNKSYKFYTKKHKDIILSYSYLSKIDYSACRELAHNLVKMFINEDFDELYFVYSRFVNTMTQEPVIFKLLPFAREFKEGTGACDDYVIEPTEKKLLEYIIPKYIEVQIYQMFMDSVASELGARLMAMTSATDNAGELIQQLTLRFYRARQEAITTEIIEVTSGAGSIKV